eukprot:1155150-Pelagomonas_calceolata.AAC.6
MSQVSGGLGLGVGSGLAGLAAGTLGYLASRCVGISLSVALRGDLQPGRLADVHDKFRQSFSIVMKLKQTAETGLGSTWIPLIKEDTLQEDPDCW